MTSRALYLWSQIQILDRDIATTEFELEYAIQTELGSILAQTPPTLLREGNSGDETHQALR